METSVERDIKGLKKLAKKFIVIGIILVAGFIYIDKAHLIKGDGSRWRYESLNNNDKFELPYKYNNLLSTKEGVLTEALLYMRQYEYDQLDVFHPGYEVVDEDTIILYDGVKNGYGITDGKGHWIIEPQYKHYNDYSNYGFFVMRGQDNVCEVIDKKGNYIIDREAGYSDIELEYGKLIVTKMENDQEQYGVCDLDGNIIVEPKYSEFANFNKFGDSVKWGYMYAIDQNDEYSLFDEEYNLLIDGGCKDIDIFKCNNKAVSEKIIFVVQDNEGKWYTCDGEGKEKMSCRYDDFDEAILKETGMLIVGKDGKKGIIDAFSDEVLLDINYEDIQVSEKNENSEYQFVVKTDDINVGLYTVSDGWCIEPAYKDIQYMSGDLFEVTTMDGKVGCYMLSKGICVDPIYKEMKHLKGDLLEVTTNDDKVGIVSGTKGVVLEPDYKKIEHMVDDLFKVTTMDDKVGIFSEEKGFVLEPDNKNIQCLHSGVYMVTTNDDKAGIFSKEKGFILEPDYKDISLFQDSEGLRYKAPNSLYVVTTNDDKVGMFSEAKGFILKPDYKEIRVSQDSSDVSHEEPYSEYVFVATTMDDKISIFTTEDGFFSEPQDVISKVEEGHGIYSQLECEYFSENKVVVFSFREGQKWVFKYGKELLYIKQSKELKFYEDYIEVWIDVWGTNTYKINYDGEKID